MSKNTEKGELITQDCTVTTLTPRPANAAPNSPPSLLSLPPPKVTTTIVPKSVSRPAVVGKALGATLLPKGSILQPTKTTAGTITLPTVVAGDKRIPLLYVQSPNNSGHMNGGKVVLQSPAQNQVTYLGTIIKQGKTGKEGAGQKVLVAPFKAKEGGTVKTLLLPTSSAGGIVIPQDTGKNVRGFVLQPGVKLIDPTQMSKFQGQPNIIRPKENQQKIMPNLNTSMAKLLSRGVTVTATERKDVSPKPPVPSDRKSLPVVTTMTPIRPSTNSNSPDLKKGPFPFPLKKPHNFPPPARKSDDGHIDGGEDAKKRMENGHELLRPPSPTERARKRKGQVSMAPWPGDATKTLPGAEKYDPLKVVEWDKQGLGSLPGSDLKFVINDFGMLELFSGTLEPSKDSSKKSDEEISCCDTCKCYGLISEFYNDQFCSKTCFDSYDRKGSDKLKKKDEDEPPDSLKKSAILKMALQESVAKLKFDMMDRVKRRRKKKEDNSWAEEMQIINLDEGSSADSDDDEIVAKRRRKQLKEDPDFKLVRGYSMKKFLKQNCKFDKAEIPRMKRKYLSVKSQEIENKSPDEDDSKSSEDPGQRKFKRLLSSESTENIPVSEEKSFPWDDYLTETQSKSAWVKLFPSPFPTGRNHFKVGLKLEAIDPEHQAYFCAVTVVEIKGYRVKLHFDGYSSLYDFWVNADSMNIFPCGYAVRHDLNFQPPQGYGEDEFDWDQYLIDWKAKPAPASCFQNTRTSSYNLFKVGMKIEAVDRRNSYLVCVATISGVLDDRVLVHFDSWDDVYDYWASTSSPFIHPVGWCKENNHELTPPNGMSPADFSWEKYLKDTDSIPAPVKAFRLRPHNDFKKGTKLEAVDKRAPHLLRVATVTEVLPYQIKITFDGFPEHFGYWVDDDSPDIHPITWGKQTGHPVEPPPPVDFESPCGTPGCVGQGHAKGTKYEAHKLIEDCPYSLSNLTNDDLKTDRFSDSSASKEVGESGFLKHITHFVSSDGEGKHKESDSEDEDMATKRWKWIQVRRMEQKAVPKRLAEKLKKPVKLLPFFVERRKEAHESLASVIPDNVAPLAWTTEEVLKFFNDTLRKECPSTCIEEEVDGVALLMIQQEDFTRLGFKLGDAIKLYNAVLLLREKVR